MKKLSILLVSGLLIYSSCKKSDDKDDILPSNSRKAYVVNEGAFGNSNGSVTRVDLESGEVIQNIFETANGRPLGDVVQSMSIYEDKGYIVVNNSQKIEVVNLVDFSSDYIISGLTSPRFVKIVNGLKAYITEWSNNELTVFDINSKSISNKISTGQGPEQLEIVGSNIYVCNSGGFVDDSTVTVISMLTESVINTIVVGLRPNSMVVDKNSKIWVLCSGSVGPDWTPGTADDVAGALVRLDPVAGIIEQKFTMNQSDHPRNLKINKDGDRLFYLHGSSDYTGEVRTMEIHHTTLPVNSVYKRQCYGLGVDPQNGIVYCGIAPSFSTNGTLIRLNSANGSVIDSIGVGIGPNGFAFDE